MLLLFLVIALVSIYLSQKKESAPLMVLRSPAKLTEPLLREPDRPPISEVERTTSTVKVMPGLALDKIINDSTRMAQSASFIPPPKILAQITTLKSESTRDSLKHFFHDDMFEFPPILTEGMQFQSQLPLDPSVGNIDLEKIMSSRRFLKLMDELGQLPKAQAGAMVNAQLKLLLEMYGPLEVERQKYFSAVSRENHGIFFHLDVSADPKPTIDGCRKAILGLILIAGNLQLKESHEAVLQVAELAVRQRDRLLREETFDKQDERKDAGIKVAFIAHVSLYARQILITGLLGTSSRINDPNSFLKTRNLSFKSKDLTRYDSPVTVGDRRLGGYHFKPDFSRGKQTVSRIADLDDRTFDTLLSELR